MSPTDKVFIGAKLSINGALSTPSAEALGTIFWAGSKLSDKGAAMITGKKYNSGSRQQHVNEVKAMQDNIRKVTKPILKAADLAMTPVNNAGDVKDLIKGFKSASGKGRGFMTKKSIEGIKAGLRIGKSSLENADFVLEMKDLAKKLKNNK